MHFCLSLHQTFIADPFMTDISSDETDNNEEMELGIVETYTILWKILRLKPMIWMVLVLLTGKVKKSSLGLWSLSQS